jgi:hypothetical protein
MPARNCSPWCFALFALIACLLAAPPAQSQCVPDNLDAGPCCAPANVVLPQFPSILKDARWICFDACQPTLNNLYCVKLGVPQPIPTANGPICGQYTIRFTLTQCGTTNVVWNGLVRANYERNWLEAGSTGAINFTVWRFTINGDFAPGFALPNTPCDRPQCLNVYNRCYFTGYIDYALDCATGVWQAAWALDHECDGIHHVPGSARPAPATGLHPTRSFTMVGPGAPFVLGAVGGPQSNGPIIQQSMRWNNWAASPAICRFEESCQGVFQAQNSFCMCNTAGAPGYIASFVNANGNCGSSVNPSPVGIFMQKRVGGWMAGPQFPGNEYLLIDLGYLAHVNGCTGVFSQEWFEGAETIGGNPAFDFSGQPLGQQFEDLESCNASSTSSATLIGGPHVPYYLLNFNLP